ncbi:MAG TPA: hypothetical protein VFJ16_03565 [Longimicrobium sp.]|nr:hypothetical protein [Longimicrobium sp.]
MTRALCAALALAVIAAAPARAQARRTDEARTAAYLAAVRERPPLLYAFLREMPKGGDLHSHLSGAVYAESFLRWAAEDSLCISRRALALVRGTCAGAGGDTLPAAAAMGDQALYDQLVDAWSMRNWNAARISGHDQFFGTFERFGATSRRVGDELAEAQARAADGRVSYLELMLTPDGSRASRLGAEELGDAFAAPGREPDFAAARQALLPRLAPVLDSARRALTRIAARRDTVLGCGTARASAGCGVEVRWLYQVGRGRPPAQVFAQILTGFELARADPRVVGFNLVMPEDGLVSMRDFTLQMRMIDYLHGQYPGVKVALHAGELSPGLVPPEGMRFHIRQSVELGHASRIGHGVDVMHEDRPHELLREMAGRGVMVEIALTSNDVILGVRGRDHPLAAYRRAGVPVALATDDQGVSRSEMPREYQRAVEDQGLDYAALKEMARTSLRHAFLEGAEVWRGGRAFTPVPECAPAAGGWRGSRCAALAGRGTRARLQRELEIAFLDFEARYAAMAPP